MLTPLNPLGTLSPDIRKFARTASFRATRPSLPCVTEATCTNLQKRRGLVCIALAEVLRGGCGGLAVALSTGSLLPYLHIVDFGLAQPYLVPDMRHRMVHVRPHMLPEAEDFYGTVQYASRSAVQVILHHRPVRPGNHMAPLVGSIESGSAAPNISGKVVAVKLT